MEQILLNLGGKNFITLFCRNSSPKTGKFRESGKLG